MVLTDEEIWQIGMQDISLDAPYGYARAIESAVLEKLKAQEPALVRYNKHTAGESEPDPDPVERLRFFLSLALTGQNWLDVEKFLDDLPPADVVRVAELEAVLRECREAMQKAKYSGTPYTSSYNRAIAKIDEVLHRDP